jgi:hypothetical protein
VSWSAALWASLGAALLTLLLMTLLSGWFEEKKTPAWIAAFCAFLGGIGLALSPTYWQNALSAKGGIYHLSLCSQLAILFLLVQDAQKNKSGWAFPAILFFTGLSLAGHWETAAIFVPAGFLYFVLGRRTEKLQWIRGGACFLLGVSPLLYLPFRAKFDPALNIGAPDRLSYFWADLSRSYYSSQEINYAGAVWEAVRGKLSWDQISPFTQKMVQQVGFFLGNCQENFGILFLGLALIGIWRWWARGERKILWFLLGSLFFLLSALASFMSMPNEWIGNKFLLSLHWMIFLWMPIGAAWTLNSLRPRYPSAMGTTVILLSGVLLLNAAVHFKQYDQSRELLVHDYGEDLLKALPKGALFFAEEDQDFFPIYYFQQVEHLRPDVVMIPTFTLFEPWGVTKVEREHPELGLTASQMSLPDHFARIIYATSELAVKNRDHRTVAFSGFKGAFHLYYLDRQKGQALRLTGLVWYLERPSLRPALSFSPAQLRVRGFEEGFTPLDGALGGLRQVYGLILNGKKS